MCVCVCVCVCTSGRACVCVCTVQIRAKQLIVVLIKRHLSLGYQDIAIRFGVNQSIISRCFSKCINVMYVEMKPLINWTKRDELMKTVPIDYIPAVSCEY